MLILAKVTFLILSAFASSQGAPADLPRPAGLPPLPAPYDQVDFWQTLEDDTSYLDLRDGGLLRTSTIDAYLRVLVERSCTSTSLPKVAVDAYQGFNQYEQMSDAYFEFLQSFNDCKPLCCSPVTSDILLIPVVVESRHHFVMANVPQQANGADCGVFDLLYADYFSRGRFPPFDFSQEHVPHFRRKMFKELNETTPSHYTSNFGLVQCE